MDYTKLSLTPACLLLLYIPNVAAGVLNGGRGRGVVVETVEGVWSFTAAVTFEATVSFMNWAISRRRITVPSVDAGANEAGLLVLGPTTRRTAGGWETFGSREGVLQH